MPDETLAAQPATPAAAAAPVETKPAEALVEGGAKAAESTPQEEATLLGKEEGKDAAPATPVVVPEKYEIKAPEGMSIDQAALDKFTPVFKDLKISQEGAQKLADAFAPYVNQLVQTQQQQAVGEFGKMVGEWKDQTTQELSKDGSRPEAELAHAAKFIDKFGGPDLRQILNETGLGNHIAVVKAFIAAGKAMANDNFPDSGKKAVPLDTEEAKAKALFPTMKEN